MLEGRTGEGMTEVRSENKDRAGPQSSAGRCGRQAEVSNRGRVERNQGRLGAVREETQNDW